jgi:hypothetical protein
MNKQEISKIRRQYKNRLKRVTDMASSHCGREGPYERLLMAEDELIACIVLEIYNAYERGVREGGKCHP